MASRIIKTQRVHLPSFEISNDCGDYNDIDGEHDNCYCDQKPIPITSQICWPMTWSENFLWELWNHIPMDNMNKTLAVHALVTLAICYLPGVNINPCQW